ncbi:MAG: DNA polymerase IV [Promethearchaeota archaeon]
MSSLLEKRIIFHVGLDAFFAAIEIRDNPALQGKPVIIGADPKKGNGRGVVTTCSYEARKFGLHSAMPISKAYKLCPHGVYLHGTYEKYQEASQMVMEILRSYNVDFQQASIDEAYLDFSELCDNFQDAYKIAVDIQSFVKRKIGITCSIGCSSTKTIAKIASDYNKPKGITIVEPEKIQEFLEQMDITKIPGIGKKTKLNFHRQGIFKIQDLYKTGLSNLVFMFGDYGIWVWNVIMGLDSRPVREHYNRKSIGKERTFMEDESSHDVVISKINDLNTRIHAILEKQKYRYNTITLKIRLTGFVTHTRSKTMKTAFRDINLAQKELEELFNYFTFEKRKIRLIGVRFSNLEQDSSKIQTLITDFV